MIWMSDWAVQWYTGLPHFNQALISQVGSLPGFCSSLLSGACRGSFLFVYLIWEMLSDVLVNCSSLPGLKLHSSTPVGRVLLTPWPGFLMKASPEESELHSHSNLFRGGLALLCVWGIFCSKNVFRRTAESLTYLWTWQYSCHISTLKWDMLKKEVEKYWKVGIKGNISCPCCCSVAQSCPPLCDPMNCSTPGFPVLHHLPEFAQTHVHWVSGAIQPLHPLSPLSLALNLSHRQGLFQWLSSSHQVVNILELQLRHQSFHWIFRVDFL